MTTNAAFTLPGLTPEEREVAGLLVEATTRFDAAIARFEALKATALSQLAAIAHAAGERSANPDGIDYARRAMAAEVAAATHTHPASAKHAMEDAELLTHDYPETHAALGEGTISAKHARVVVEAGSLLEPDARAAFDVATAPIAAEMTPGDLSRVAKKRAAEAAEMSPRERHALVRKRRYVSITDRDDGMSDLRIYGPSLELHAVYDRATKLAKVIKQDRTRVRDQYRRKVGHPVGAECEVEACKCRAMRAAGAGASGTALNGGASGVGRATDAPTPDHYTGAPGGASVHGATSPLPDAPVSAAASPGTADSGCGDGSGAGQGFSDSATTAANPTLTAATDHRTLDQVRTDVLVDILLGAEPTGHDLYAAGTDATLSNIQAEVQVTIPSTMILDPDDGAAWLDAGTLISPDSARHLAGTAPGWDRLFYRPDTGQVEQIDHYRPLAWQKRALIGRDITCRFPGCTLPARKADIDHTHAFAEGGRTTMSNLACLCEAHHVMKHQSDWRMRQLDDGVIEWTSPTGRTYETEPPSRVFFREEPPPDPAPPQEQASPSPQESALPPTQEPAHPSPKEPGRLPAADRPSLWHDPPPFNPDDPPGWDTR
ncbi:hypothetical protein GCM10010922_03410 [Microbacterium sorbitolivorans]|uniref:HNH endonuclease n=1 Tax=Microbacterium sorbitolivorans TaxID=1867410 RepID=A0A367Y927_9MICO|nr:HNH endonuclease signature motif containing protein [Microbacterium sorbitolivorans]RCK61501.1 HNH endonuclease [Microbacterium sorbitolivorans]GGF31647.1 hypothetical protein GCM10010922_03410 [Microbacterium sorbitolivorans]